MTTDFYPWKLGDPESPGENSHLGGKLPRVAQFIFCPSSCFFFFFFQVLIEFVAILFL